MGEEINGWGINIDLTEYLRYKKRDRCKKTMLIQNNKKKIRAAYSNEKKFLVTRDSMNFQKNI